MKGAKEEFKQQILDKWLPLFCLPRDFSTQGYDSRNANLLDDHDAYWFSKTMELALVKEKGGFFYAPHSKAKEQIFWEGSKSISPRPLSLWLEPVITIGAVGRLFQEFGWPQDQLGMQSESFAFDLVAYTPDSREYLVCEVKKTVREIETLVEFMKEYAGEPKLSEEPTDAKRRNAYRKVIGIRKAWPSVFWALGPAGYGYVFEIHRTDAESSFKLRPADLSALSRPVA